MIFCLQNSLKTLPDTGGNYLSLVGHDVPQLLIGRHVVGTAGHQRQAVDVHDKVLLAIDSGNVDA